MKALPIEFSQYLKSFAAWCEQYQKLFYPKHLEEHGLKRISIKDLFENLEQIVKKSEQSTTKNPSLVEKGKTLKLNRKQRMDLMASHIRTKLTEIESLLKIYARNF